MDAKTTAQWMFSKLKQDKCLYQDDVVDFVVKTKDETNLKENIDGNLVLKSNVLNEFKKLTETNVVWVKAGFYWRFRVKEDEEGRNARG